MPSRLPKYFSEQAAEATRGHVREAGGNEVFLVGHVNGERLVESVEVFARGNEFSAPALLQVAKQGDVVIHNHPNGVLRPSSADTHVASILGNDGVGFYIVDNPVSDVYVMVEPFAEKEIVPVDVEQLSALLAENGEVAQKLEQYEYRAQQIDMMKKVAEAFNDDKIALIEAGTGTGKTLAYLIPAILYAVNNEERVVVSTNTINLQEQLINKDLPFLQKVLGVEFNAVLVKGRSNYGCKRKLLEASQSPELFSEDEHQSDLNAILDWARTTKDGSKSDLSFIPKSDVWEKVQSESDTSLKTRCPFYNECFFYSARRKAAKADVLVANHHLLFSDLALRALKGASENAVLPTYDRIILDEAHNVEEVATNYFGTGVTYLGILRILRQLYHVRHEKEKGMLPFLSAKLTKLGRAIPYEKFYKAQSLIQEDGIQKLDALSSLLTETMESIYQNIQGRFEGEDYVEKKLRLVPRITQHSTWQDGVVQPMRKLLTEMRRFTSKLNELLRLIEVIESKAGPAVVSLSVDLQAQLERLDATANSLEHVLLDDDELHVRWLEVKEGYKQTKIVRFRSSPIDVAPILQETVYNKFKSVVMTSATLTVEGRFDYIRKRLGLDQTEPGRIVQAMLPGNFDYESQVLLGVPGDIPDPNNSAFVDALQRCILESVKLSQGRAFVLFTSYGLLNKLYRALKPQIETLGFNVYKQGEENRHRLLQRFRDDVSSVLFATDSFWEGVDVHGQALESVIITKLPFRVPSEPIIEARVEAIEKRGGNAFLEYTVPQAVIKFKQGFGRLIRRKSDRGSVLILDKRVIYKSYGRLFLNSLPKPRVAIGPSEQVFSELQDFFVSRRKSN